MNHLVILYSLLLVDILIFIVLLTHILLRRRGTSETRLAWMVFIILVPYLGALIYLMVGGVYVGRRFREFKKGKRTKLNFVEHPELVDLPGIEPETPDPYRRVFTLAENMCQSDLVGGNALELKGNTKDFLKSLCEDIDSATETVHLLTYIYLTDSTGHRVGDALRAASGRGVTCRLLVDSLGSRAFLKSTLRRLLEADGVKIVEALPASLWRIGSARIDLRNHRKIVVVDNQIAYVGSQNIADPAFAPKAKYAPWIDCMVRLRGPAVHDLQRLFLEDWYLDTGEVNKDLLEVVPHVHTDGADVQIIENGPEQIRKRDIQSRSPVMLPCGFR